MASVSGPPEAAPHIFWSQIEGVSMARILAMSVEIMATSLGPKSLILYQNSESLQPYAPNPKLKPQTLNTEPDTRNPKPETRNPKPKTPLRLKPLN